jgi:hypothetical protein
MHPHIPHVVGPKAVAARRRSRCAVGSGIPAKHIAQLLPAHARCQLRRMRGAEHNGKLGSGRDRWVACGGSQWSAMGNAPHANCLRVCMLTNLTPARPDGSVDLVVLRSAGMSAEGGRGAVHGAGTRVSYNRGERHPAGVDMRGTTCEERCVVAHGC